VYILILPAFGMFSEIVATFSKKRLFGYKSMVAALMAITVLSFLVWLHHFFTMGAGGNVNAFFGIMTMVIAIPTGVKVFNWLFTMYRGRIRLSTPMLWFVGFVVTFTIGGATGVMLAIPPADFQFHNSLFLVAQKKFCARRSGMYGTPANIMTLRAPYASFGHNVIREYPMIAMVPRVITRVTVYCVRSKSRSSMSAG
jgi:hypothetical protein